MSFIWDQRKSFWITASMASLLVVALLGLLMRYKMVLPLPLLPFKNILHAHSHFAFAGWITLALTVLMIQELLPARSQNRRIYQWLLGALLACALGMLLSFPFQGYGFYSILFSTLFVFSTYGISYVLIRDLRRQRGLPRPVRSLAISSLVFLSLSSAGPFTLAGLMATKSANVVLYLDAVYTYLYLQYTGFFGLAILALLLHRLSPRLDAADARGIGRVAALAQVSVLPSLFLSYLWHNPPGWVWQIAGLGSALLLLHVAGYIWLCARLWPLFKSLSPLLRMLTALAATALICKCLLQALTIIPGLGELVFVNRPVIIGYLHLVLLAGVSIYILLHFVHLGWLPAGRPALGCFAAGIVLNELALLSQGLMIMLGSNSALFNWLLLAAALMLAAGAGMLLRGRLILAGRERPAFKSFSLISLTYKQ